MLFLPRPAALSTQQVVLENQRITCKTNKQTTKALTTISHHPQI